MKNKKGQTSTDTPIIMSMIIFQAFIILCLGFLNTADENVTTETTYGSSIIGFSVNIVTNLSILGWGNI